MTLDGMHSPAIQAILKTSTSSTTTPLELYPHHPITCEEELAFHEDGSFACPHGTAPAGDERTQMCLHTTLAILLIEIALETL